MKVTRKKRSLQTSNVRSQHIKSSNIQTSSDFTAITSFDKKRENRVFLILEFAANGNLFRYIRSNPKAFADASQKLELYRKICQAVSFIHGHNMVHRDIKPENILIDDHLQPKLCDFGWTINLEKNESRQTFCGTYEYMAPEIFEAHSYNSSVDIWSLGILLFELFHGHSPYSGSSVFQIYKNIVNQKLVFKEGVHPMITGLISRILQIKPEKRPTIDEILADKCLTEPLPEIPGTSSSVSRKGVFGKPSAFISKFKPKATGFSTANPDAEPKPTLPLPSRAENDNVNEESLTAKRAPTLPTGKGQKMVVKFQFSKAPADKQSLKPSEQKDESDHQLHRVENAESVDKSESSPTTPIDNLKDRNESAHKTIDYKKINPKNSLSIAGKFNAHTKTIDLKKLGSSHAVGDTNEASQAEGSVAASHGISQEKKIIKKNFDIIKMIGKQKEQLSISETAPAATVMTPTSKPKFVTNKLSLNQLSKNISLYINSKQNGVSKGAGIGLPRVGEPGHYEHGATGTSNNVTENSLSQNEFSKNSMSNFSIQPSKPHAHSYFSNRSNILDKKTTPFSGSGSSAAKSILEKMNARKNHGGEGGEDAKLRDSKLFKNMISCHVKTGVERLNNDGLEDGIDEGSNIYSKLGNPMNKIDNSRVEKEAITEERKPILNSKEKIDSGKRVIDFKTKLGLGLPAKKSLTGEARPAIGLTLGGKPAATKPLNSAEATHGISKRLANILKK